uniref:Dihydrolipoyl dehydrogenase n=1 Tax=Acidicaldus sp. TaxID=1872105 RepID=A0A8J4M5X3_9PROT
MANEISVDVLILGAGGGGYPAAFRLHAAGRKVVMADPIGNLGGDCLAEGCVPSKAVREAGFARVAADRFAHFGLSGARPGMDWPSVLRHKDRVQNIRYAQHAAEIAKAGLTLLKGRGRIIDDHRVEVTTEAGDVTRYHATNLILATGSTPHVLPIPGAELALTSHDVFRLNADLAFPQRLVAIGGGYIGLETASMLQNLGARATVLEATGEILPGADADLARFLHIALARRMDLIVNAKVSAIQRDPQGGLLVRYESGGEPRTIAADCVLMATGRATVLPPGAETLGFRAHGGITVDDHLRTALPHIYAPGDINGRSPLFHAAVCQSWLAAGDILSAGQGIAGMNFAAVPFTVFTEPEIAWVGLTTAEAAQQGIKAAVTVYDDRTDSRAQIFGETEGFIKLVFATATRRLIGAQVAGLDAAHIIAPLALAIAAESTAEALSAMAFPHPMLTEGINKAARSLRA